MRSKKRLTVRAAVVVIAMAGLMTTRLGAGSAPGASVSAIRDTGLRAHATGSANPGLQSMPAHRAIALSAASADTPADVYKLINPAAYQACYNTPHGQHFATSDYLSGYSDVVTLGGSAALGFPAPALALKGGSDEGTSLAGAHVPVPGGTDGYVCTFVELQLDYQGKREFPPVRATFLAFGFTPVTATVQITQTGPLLFSDCIESDGTTSPACPPVTVVFYSLTNGPGGNYGDYQVVATSQVTLRVSDVKVDGVPLDVGPDCQSAGILTSPDSPAVQNTPLGPNAMVLTGGDLAGEPEPAFSGATAGGELAGSIKIPPFTGCGPADDLDPLVTASLSHDGNYASVTSGPLCSVISPSLCKPSGAFTSPADEPLWTVGGGGTYSGTSNGPLTVTAPEGAEGINVTCQDSDVSGTVPNAAGPPRGGLGTLRWTRISGCTTASGSAGGPWTITQQGSGVIGGVSYQAGTGPSGTGLMNGEITGISLQLTDPGGCTVDMTGGAPAVTYTNPPAPTMSLPRNVIQFSVTSTGNCPAGFSTEPLTGGQVLAPGGYTISPGTITISSPTAPAAATP